MDIDTQLFADLHPADEAPKSVPQVRARSAGHMRKREMGVKQKTEWDGQVRFPTQSISPPSLHVIS